MPKFHVISCVFSVLPLPLPPSLSPLSPPLPPRGWKVQAPERPLRSWRRHIGWRNTKICIHGASWMGRKRGKWNVENCNFLKVNNCGFLLVSYLSEVKTVSMFYNSSLFYYFLQLISAISRQKLCCHFKIRLIWTAMSCDRSGYFAHVLPKQVIFSCWNSCSSQYNV